MQLAVDANRLGTPLCRTQRRSFSARGVGCGRRTMHLCLGHRPSAVHPSCALRRTPTFPGCSQWVGDPTLVCREPCAYRACWRSFPHSAGLGARAGKCRVRHCGARRWCRAQPFGESCSSCHLCLGFFCLRLLPPVPKFFPLHKIGLFLSLFRSVCCFPVALHSDCILFMCECARHDLAQTSAIGFFGVAGLLRMCSVARYAF